MKERRKGFWQALERLAGGAVRVEWQEELGHEAERAWPLLRPVNGLASTYPCTNPLGCECPHRVEELAPGRWLAVCGPDEGCPPIALAREDLLVYAVDSAALCSGIARSLGLVPCGSRKVAGSRAERVGTYNPAAASTYLMFPGDSARMMREVERLFCAQPDPFILLTPTGAHCSADVESALRRQLCMHIALSGAVVLRADGSLMPTGAATPLLEEFVRRKREGRSLAVATARFVFRKNGRHWGVVFDGGAEFSLENTLGARYLDYLLHHPNEPISAYDLEVAIQPEKASVRPKDSIQTKLDPDAVRQYLRELSRLRSQREGADKDGDLGEVDRLDGEIDALEQALKGGNESGDAGERARGNVGKAIAAVRRKLKQGGKSEKAFADHIDRFVDTGYQCMYHQEGDDTWG